MGQTNCERSSIKLENENYLTSIMLKESLRCRITQKKDKIQSFPPNFGSIFDLSAPIFVLKSTNLVHYGNHDKFTKHLSSVITTVI